MTTAPATLSASPLTISLGHALSYSMKGGPHIIITFFFTSSSTTMAPWPPLLFPPSQPSTPVVSPPSLVPPWVQWSNELAREMYIKRALNRLQLQYPDDS